MKKEWILESKEDYKELLNMILEPLEKLANEKESTINLTEEFAAQYGDKVSSIETFSRLLWGANAISSELNYGLKYKIINMIINGTNPKSDKYWGEIEDYDQLIVEMLPMIMFCYDNIEYIEENTTKNELKNIEKWFNKINEKKVSDNNWLFFKILVNIFLKKCKMRYDLKEINIAFEKIEKMYLGDGWYSDGISKQRDYYISFAIQYYSLLYLKYAEDKEREKLIKERAILFAKDFIYWFSDNGEAIPFGRSLTYKFAQISFWSALILNELYPLHIEDIKGIINRNLRWWLKQSIFNSQGEIELGYAYKNTLFTENYNSSGSSYWALKAFIFLKLDLNNKFFSCREEIMPKLKEQSFQKHSFMNICRDDREVIAFVNGQMCLNEFSHMECKYEKFAYSTLSGFSISKAHKGIQNCGCDSTITVSEDEKHFFSRTDVNVIKNCEGYMHSVWTPWSDVEIETIIIPKLPMHIRIHKINSKREFYLYDGGFSIDNTDLKNKNFETKNNISIKNNTNIVGVVSILGCGEKEVINLAPNTNLLYRRVSVPIMKWKVKKGNYVVITGVYSARNEMELENILNKLPMVNINKTYIDIEGIKIQKSKILKSKFSLKRILKTFKSKLL